MVDASKILEQWDIDYSKAFSVVQILLQQNKMDDIENIIEITYNITNVGKRDDLTFYTTLNGKTDEKQLKVGEAEEGSFFVNIGKPAAYDLTYPIKYEVKFQDKTLWSKEDTIQYDCKDVLTFGKEEINDTYLKSLVCILDL